MPLDGYLRITRSRIQAIEMSKHVAYEGRSTHGATSRVLRAATSTYYEKVHGWLIIILFAIYFPFYIFIPSGTPGRWAIYALPAISLLFWFILAGEGKLKIDGRYFGAAIVYGLVVLVSSFNAYISYISIQEVLFILGALIVFIPKFTITANMITVLLLSNFSAMVGQYFLRGFGERFTLDLSQSYGLLENSFGVTIAAIAIYYFARKKTWFLILALVLVVASFKRIAILGFLVAASYLLFIWFLRRGRMSDDRVNRISVFVAVFALIPIWYVSFQFTNVVEYLYYDLGFFDDLVSSTGGRYVMMQHAENTIQYRGFWGWVFGSGPGSSTFWVKGLHLSGFPFLLNDWMRILFDSGFLGFLTWTYLTLRIFASNYAALSIFIYSSIIAITDASFMYFVFMVTFFFVGRALENEA